LGVGRVAANDSHDIPFVLHANQLPNVSQGETVGDDNRYLRVKR
jgi:hypothetical protein